MGTLSDACHPATGVRVRLNVRGPGCRRPACQPLRHTRAPLRPPYQPIRYPVTRHRGDLLETYNTTRSPGDTLARPAKPSTAGTDRLPHGTPNAAVRRCTRHPADGTSITPDTAGRLDAPVAGALGLVAVGFDEANPVPEGTGDGDGPDGPEHPTATNTAIPITTPSNRREKFTRSQ